jgi:hypothetical protein
MRASDAHFSPFAAALMHLLPVFARSIPANANAIPIL